MKRAVYTVGAGGLDLPVAGSNAVVFHGINKSGSMAMARVLLGAYRLAGREAEFHCHYFGIPKTLEENRALIAGASGAGLFIGHDLFRSVTLPPGTRQVTQVRHPLPRILSVYSWLKGMNARAAGPDAPFPSLTEWLERSQGRAHSQIAQLTLGYDPARQPRAYTNAELRDCALENLSRDFAWFGVAEIFEESIFALAAICGLARVPLWEKDERNTWRKPTASHSAEEIALIREVYADEFRFYDGAVALFRRRIANADFGADLAPYKAACQASYRERIALDDAAAEAAPEPTSATTFPLSGNKDRYDGWLGKLKAASLLPRERLLPTLAVPTAAPPRLVPPAGLDAGHLEAIRAEAAGLGPWTFGIRLPDGTATGADDAVARLDFRLGLVAGSVLQLCGGSIADLSVLDVACDNAAFALALGQRGARVTAVDASRENLARGAFLARTFGVADVAFVADEAGAAPAEHDVVLCLRSLYLATDPHAVARRVFGLCRSFAVIDCITHHSPLSAWIQRFTREVAADGIEIQRMEFHPTYRALLDLLHAVGFARIVEVVPEESEPGPHRALYDRLERRCLVAFR